MTRFVVAALALLVTLAFGPMPQSRQEDDAAIMNHRLTLDLLRKTIAFDRALLALIDKDPALMKAMEGKTTPGIDASAKALEDVPQVGATLKANGLTGRDYVLTQIAMMSATMTRDMVAKGIVKEMPPGMPTHNIEFLKTNAAELEKLEAEWKTIRGEIQKRAR
jgi:hypothetical protein